MIVSLIVAMSENRVIGRDGELPWRLPADMRRFRSLTMGHHLILGRRTYDSLHGPLEGRKMIVVSRKLQAAPADAALARSFPAALEIAREAGESEVFVGGGAAIYAEALNEANRIYLTLVHADLEGDTFFPLYSAADWMEAWAEKHPVDAENQYPFTFKLLDRAVKPPPLV
ncbi:MAG: dihydrofolate reductase [Anaerolineales bacterium]|nr:dihydrofolate reductase [Anaerolineales bacterium]